MDFADAELMDNTGEVTAAAIARDLGRGTAIPAGWEGGGGGGGGGGGSAGASSWLSRLLTSCRRRLLSSRHSVASSLLMPPLLFASCTPPLPFASCLPDGCHVAPVVAPLPTLPCDFASTSSLPSGCHILQGPTYRAAADSASQLCLDLFFTIWLSHFARPHLSRRRRLLSSSRLCLATRHRLITGCVVARH